MKTVVGLFHNSSDANNVVRDLESAGITRQNINLYQQGAEGLADTLTSSGVPSDHARRYVNGIRHGRTLVTVPSNDTQAPTVLRIMDRYNPINIEDESATAEADARMASSAGTAAMSTTDIAGASTHVGGETARIGGETSFAGQAGFAAGTTAQARTNVQGETTVPVVEEELRVGKREVERGGVRVETRVEERPVEEQVSLREEHVRVERRPVDRPATAADFNEAFKESSIELTERAEVAVVQKEARVVEEVVVGKEATQHTETVRDTVRRTDVDIQPVASTTSSTDFERYESDFRTNFQSSNPGGEYTFDQAKPAYHLGHTLASDRSAGGGDWTSVEPDARRRWEERNPGTWEKMKDAARYAYDRARQKTS